MGWTRTVANLFWLWTVLGTALAWFVPGLFTWAGAKVAGTPFNLIHLGLGIIMLGMGLTLSLSDLRSALAMPKAALIGIVGQFLLMPFIGWGIARAFRLEEQLALGVILVSCCPGGTASNVVSYLARANVALSVLMTMCSTLLAIVLTPYLTKGYASIELSFEVPAGDMVLTMVVIVLIPVLLGVFLNSGLGERLRAVREVSPLVSILVIVIIVGAIVGGNKEDIAKHFGVLFIAVFLVHVAGFLLGYFWARIFGLGERECRTVCIEVGMQNSGLGVALATRHFSALAAAPCAISALYHCLIGSFLASIWRARRFRGDGEAPDSQDST